MRSGRFAAIVILACAALLGGGKTAAASGEYGILAHYMSFEGPDETGLKIDFHGVYAAGSFALSDITGEYRVALGTSDRFQRERGTAPVEEGRFYLIDLGAGVVLAYDGRSRLALRAGALFIWGADDGGGSYRYLVGRAGIGLAERFRMGRINLAAEGDVFLALAYLDDRIDLGEAVMLEGAGIEGGISASLPLPGGAVLACGLHLSLAAGCDLFSEGSESGTTSEIEFRLGVAF